MTLLFLRLFGALLARLPLPAIQVLTAFAGEFVFVFARRRRRELLSNLSHAFPDRDDRWILATGRTSIHQMIEFALLAGALPSCDETRLHKLFFMSPESAKLILDQTASGRPAVVVAPHLGPQEGLCLLPFLVPGMAPIGGIYRPVKNQAVDQWIRESRERFGVQLFSRKNGLQSAIRLLKENHWIGLLFDQNSSATGTLITFFDRVASATDLPGILAARYEADIIFLYARRHSFWRIELRAVPGPKTRERDEITFATNRWLEELLRHDEQLTPGWLWAHNRWRHQRLPQFALREKKNLLEKQNAFLKRDSLPRTERFFVRLPDNPHDVTALLPLLNAIRQSRPDINITAIGHASLLPAVQEAGLCEQAIPLPPNGPSYFLFFHRLRRQFPRVYIVFSDSRRHDLEAWLTGAPHRYGVSRQDGRRRRLLTHVWTPPPEQADTGLEQTQLWEAFVAAHGASTVSSL